MINDRTQDRVGSAIKQMREIIDRYIRGSINGDIYDKALECLIILRESCINEDEAPLFNRFMYSIKENYSTGHQKGFFDLLISKNISLITCFESELSSIVSPEEAENFLKSEYVKPEAPARAPSKPDKDDDIDLLD